MDLIEDCAKAIWLSEFTQAFNRQPTDPWENQADSTKDKHRVTARAVISLVAADERKVCDCGVTCQDVDPECRYNEIHSSDGGVEARHAKTGNKAGSLPEEARYPSATRFVREEAQGAAIQPCAGVAPGPSEAKQEPVAFAVRNPPFRADDSSHMAAMIFRHKGGEYKYPLYANPPSADREARLESVLRDIVDADEREPSQPDDADWRFRFLECKRIAALALSPPDRGGDDV